MGIIFKNIVKTNAVSFEMETSKVKTLYENELGKSYLNFFIQISIIFTFKTMRKS